MEPEKYIIAGEITERKIRYSGSQREEDYRSWDIHAETTENKYIAQITETDDYFSELARTSKMVFVVKNSSWPDDEQFSHLLDEMGKIGVNTEELRKSGGGDWILTDTIDGSLIIGSLAICIVALCVTGEALQQTLRMEKELVFKGKKYMI